MEVIHTKKAPEAIGPYSQGIKAGDLIFVSGQLPLIPESGEIVKGEMQSLTRQVIRNLQAVLEQAGSSLEKVIRTEIFMTDLKEFASMNEEYARHFKGPTYPARQTIQVAALPKGASIEISCIALI